MCADMVDPISGDKLNSNDIIHVFHHGTGFCSSGGAKVATVQKPSMMAG
jgi:hypothetical protein